MHASGHSQAIAIPRTLELLAHSWVNAEKSLQSTSAAHWAEPDEEFITQRFQEQLSTELHQVSAKKQVESAFLDDLRAAFPGRRYAESLVRIADGIVAQVTRHKRATEGRTGGDLGLLIIRPQLRQIRDTFSESLCVRPYRRGLLCQAKLKSVISGKWGKLTEPQKLVLLGHTQYLALLLYMFTADNATLDRFAWQVCQGTSLPDIESWLKRGSFPAIQRSGEIIKALGRGDIGTDDGAVIDATISPTNNPALILRISWRSGKDPGSSVELVRRAVVRENDQLQYQQLGA